MSAITFRHPAESGSYRPFRDEAVSRQVRQLERFQFRRNHTNERALRLKSSTGSVKVGIALGRTELSRRKCNAFVAALALAAAVLSSTAAASLFASDVNKVVSRNPACVEAGQRLAPWFKAETDRKVQVGLNERDDFNILVTWFRNAQSQCASGMTARAVENFHAIESMIAERVEQQQPHPEGE
jgi:hypothetical protein